MFYFNIFFYSKFNVTKKFVQVWISTTVCIFITFDEIVIYYCNLLFSNRDDPQISFSQEMLWFHGVVKFHDEGIQRIREQDSSVITSE